MTKQEALNLAIEVLRTKHEEAYEEYQKLHTPIPGYKTYLNSLVNARFELSTWKPGDVL